MKLGKLHRGVGGVRSTLRIAAMLVLSAGTMLGLSVVAPSVAHADGAGPAYFLYSSNSGEYGPCGNTVGAYQGEFSIGNYYYRSQYKGHRWIGDTSIYDYQDQGFNTAYRYKGCYNSYPAYGYYGAHKIVRDYTVEYECPADQMSCVYRGTHYGGWYSSGW